MIILIYGDFCAGKDTVADILVKNMRIYHPHKILSYTTRQPRYDGEETHEFCTKEEFLAFDDVVAQTEINGELYGARACQFDPNSVNIYVVDDKGVYDIQNSSIDDDIFVIEVIRPEWLNNCPKNRNNRDRKFNNISVTTNYRLVNDGDLNKLERDCLEVIKFWSDHTINLKQ